MRHRGRRIRHAAGILGGALLAAATLPAAADFAGQAGENIARGKTYRLSPPPNYRLCTDPEDRVQLTDGETTGEYFWTQPSTVGWRGARYVSITVDLGRVEPIAGAALRTAAGTAGVRWPGAVLILVSDNGRAFGQLGDLVAMDRRLHGPWPDGYAIRRLISERLRSRGRFVRFLIFPQPGSPYIFTDEVEVFRGPAELLRGGSSGTPVEDADRLFARWRTRTAARRRFETDLAALERAIRDARLPDEATRRLLQRRWAEAAAGLRASPIADADSFRAVLPFNSAHAELFEVQAALWRAEGAGELVCWVTTPWDPLDPFAGPPHGSSGVVEMELMRGEWRAATVNLANSTQKPIRVGLEFRGLHPQRVCEVPWTDTVEGRPVAAALVEAQETHTGRSMLVPAGLVRQVWLEYRAADAEAEGQPRVNRQKGTILIRRGEDDQRSIDVRLRVYPVRFPARTSLLVGGWSYTNGPGRYGITPENRRALLAELQSHHVNAPWASSRVMMRFDLAGDDSVRLDTREFDDWIAQWPEAARYHVFLAVSNRFAGAEMGTPQFERRVGAWISAWVRHLTSKGIAPGRLALLLKDEPHEGSDVTGILAWARAIRAAEPQVLIWEDPTYRDPAKAPAALFDACDVLCPNRPMWLAQGEPFARFYLEQQRKGRSLQFYSCSGPARLLDPYSYYRLQAWHAWEVGATGSFFWAFGDNGGASSWNPCLARSGPYTPLFLDRRTVTGSKHLEAVREGAQDYEYLAMLRRAVQQAEAAGRSDAQVARARSVLRTAAAEVLSAEGADRLGWHEPKDRTLADKQRGPILRALTGLQKQTPQ